MMRFNTIRSRAPPAANYVDGNYVDRPSIFTDVLTNPETIVIQPKHHLFEASIPSTICICFSLSRTSNPQEWNLWNTEILLPDFPTEERRKVAPLSTNRK
ncbi:hypothetical protein RvY_14624-3 [Ramazzottius varieornatus]|uniref:Uncharacterized protein n=1 Tax=Ramazzottius varieornatus TaxID=947166 RepID=A0A1D1VRY7_RAMVA|nr:hypothetical protein RvY_14624-3 [Ramazzottius varieornatus]